MNAASHKEIMKILRAGPGWGFNDVEVHPLCDVDQAMDAAVDARQKLGR